MAHHAQDALLLTSPADIFYVTGFLTRFWESPARPWFLAVPDRGAPVAVIPAIGQELMARTWIDDVRTWEAPDPIDDGVGLLADTLCGFVGDNGRIGVLMGLETHLRMPLADYHRLTEKLGTRKIVDATRIVQRVREVKSEPEIEKITAACAIADRAFAHIPELVSAGKSLDIIFREFQIALLAEGADWVSYLAGGAGKDGYGDVISPAPATPLQKGDILMLDTGAVRDGYFCDFDRNFAVGTASDGARRAYDDLYAATEHALERMRPGMLARDAHRLLRDHLVAAGASPLAGRLGHGLGITLTE